MTINIGILVLALGLPIVLVLWKTAAREDLCGDARGFSGTCAFLTAVGTVIAACLCFIDKATINTSDIIQFHQSPSVSEKYSQMQ